MITEVTDFNSDSVEGLYAKTKAETARYVMDAVKNQNLNACIIHPSGIIGPNDFSKSHLTQLVKQVSTGKLFACVKGGYDFVDVRDVVDGIINACKKENTTFTKYSLYTLSSNSNFSNEKAKKQLNFKNRNMKDTIKDTVEWIEKTRIEDK